ncbi:MAG: damage repair protein [Bacilli bacterium]|nr:damage repair protein [Bacilli bacterium]
MEQRRSIAVIDLKAFYSFVECVDRGLDPWKTPLVVADKERGKNTIVLSVSPYLKSRGVPSRLRIQDLPKKYNYVYAIPRMERYIEKSAEVVKIMMEFVSEEDIHVYSIDEAFIDLTTYLNYYHKTPMQMVSWIIDTIKEKTGLQATGGIGDNFFLAKVALDIYAKHERNGIAVMRIEDIEEKLWPITPLSKIWGIGSRTEAHLNKLGIFDMNQLAHSNREFMRSEFGIMGEQLVDHANGIDDSDIREVYVPKERSLSQAQVLFKDYKKDEAPLIIREMCDDLSSKLRKEEKLCGLVSLFVGYSKNQGGFARQMSLLQESDDRDVLYQALMEIYKAHIIDLPIRNVGISFGKLKSNKQAQLSLFEESEKQVERHKMQKTMDKLQDKYGKNILLRASALTENSTVIERNSYIGGHRK